MCIDLTVGEHSVLPHNAESGDRWANNVRPCGYAVANEFIMESLRSFSIFNYSLIFCSVYLSEQLCYTIY